MAILIETVDLNRNFRLFFVVETPLSVRLLNADCSADLDDLQSVFEAAPSFGLLHGGKPPSPTAAQDLFTSLPPDKQRSDQFVYGFYDQNNCIVACAEVINGYPDASIAFIGLLLFAEFAQGQSNGPWAVDQLAAISATWGCSLFRIAVLENNPRALAFWQREGFVELYRKPSPEFDDIAICLERAIYPNVH